MSAKAPNPYDPKVHGEKPTGPFSPTLEYVKRAISAAGRDAAARDGLLLEAEKLRTSPVQAIPDVVKPDVPSPVDWASEAESAAAVRRAQLAGYLVGLGAPIDLGRVAEELGFPVTPPYRP